MAKNSLALKLAEVMDLVAYVQKDGQNTFHKYKYASAEKVYQKVNAELSSRGIAVSSNCELLHQGVREAKNGDVAMDVIARVTLTLVDGESGETLGISGLGQGSDKGDKATMKAVTAATKYALSTGFLISWGDDPEADVETDRMASKADFDSLLEQGQAVNNTAAMQTWATVVGKAAKHLSDKELAQLKKLKEDKQKEISK